MRIIIEGDRNIHERVLAAVKRFSCSTCGCVFDAGLSEYEEWGVEHSEYAERYTFIFCTCPHCANKVWRRMADA